MKTIYIVIKQLWKDNDKRYKSKYKLLLSPSFPIDELDRLLKQFNWCNKIQLQHTNTH